MARVAALRRYPVKAMGGEALEEVVLDARGLLGDRWYAVVDDEGRLASGKNSRRMRRRDAVLAHAATGDPGSVQVRLGDRVWTLGEDLDAALSQAVARPVQVRAEEEVPHQDAGSVSLVGTASLRWVAEHLEVDTDPRRLRVNIVVETSTPFEEESWSGEVVLGEVVLGVMERIERCRTVDLALDGLTATTPLLKALGGERELCLGIYLDVVRPGPLRVGDEVIALG